MIEDYEPTAGQVRKAATGPGHVQVNDPARGAAAIVTIALADDPPVRLPLGPDAVGAVEGKLQRTAEELTKCRDLAVSTTFDDATRE